ncbi:MAG: aminopeptidase [Haloferacaceae archaeon]
MELELSEIAHTIVDDLIEVEADEEVFVVCDAEREPIARAVVSAARGADATGLLTVAPRVRAYGNEPPATVAEAMRTADVAVTVMNTSLSHTRARRAASDAGTQTLNLRGVTVDTMLEGGIDTDYAELERRTMLVRDALLATDAARVTSPTGTDVTLDIAGRQAYSLDGAYSEAGHEERHIGLPTGEAPTSPTEGTADGTVVVDHSMDELGLLEAPVEIEIEAGRATEVRGGEDARRLRRLLEEHDGNARNLAEFAIGTNPDARLTGVLAEDKKVDGTVHFALGDNLSIGGSVESDLHVDGMVTRPTVDLDGTRVLHDREIDWDAVRAVAGRE